MSEYHYTFKLLAIIIFTFLLSACGGGSGTSNNVSGQSIYIDSSLGNDQTGNGSISAPYRSLSKLVTLQYNTATTVYLKRGDIWYEGLDLPASNITLDAYGSGALPIIDGSSQISNWSSLGNGLYSATVSLAAGDALGNLSENGTMMTFVPWQTDANTTFTGASTGGFSYEYATNTLYIKPATNPASNTYRVSTQLRGIYAHNLSDITIRNLQIERFSMHGIELDNCTRCSVTNTNVIDSGGAIIGSNPTTPPDYLYAGNGIDISNSSQQITISNVSIDNIFDSCLTVEVYNSNNTASSLDLGSATLSRCGFAGVELSVQSNQGTNINSSINTVSLHDIQVDNTGHGWSGRRYGTTGHGMRIVADQGAGSMKYITITRCSVTHSAGDGIKLAGELGLVTMHRIQSAHNSGAGINVTDPNATSLAIKLSSSLIYNNIGNGLIYNAPNAAGLQIYQNSFVDNGSINIAIYGQNNLADIRSNLFYASSAMTDLYVSGSLVNPIVDHNCYNDVTNMFGYNNVAYSSVSSFRTATGFEANGIGSGTVGLTNPAAADFSLQVGSECIGLGDASDGIPEDYAGKNYASPPASGAYAYP